MAGLPGGRAVDYCSRWGSGKILLIFKGIELAFRWYVLACTPRKERVIYHQLQDKGYEVFYPYLINRTKDPNTLKIEPYFPGYLFVKVDLSEVSLSAFQWMPMTSGLVCMAGIPAFVPDTMIRAIQRSLSKANSRVLGMPDNLETPEAEEHGRSELPENGKLFDSQISGEDRAKVLLQFLQQVGPAT